MASSLEKKQIDELLAKQQAIAVREQRRVDELERRNEHFLEQITSSLIVPASAFGMSYARAYFGDEASSICGIPIDAAAGLAMHALAACFGISLDKDAQSAAKILHSVANGALASWTASLGAEFGAKKRLERPAPPPPNRGEEELPTRAPKPMTREELDEIIASMRSKTQPSMPERPPGPAPMPQPTPLPIPVQQTANPLPTAQSVTAKVPAPAPAPQSTTAPPAPLNERANSVAASAKSVAAPEVTSTPQAASRDAKPWVFDPEAEMRALLQSHGAPSDPKTVAHVLRHENAIEAFRTIVRGAQVPTKSAEAKVPTPAPVLQSSTPPQSPLNAHPAIKKPPRRSLTAARTVGITEATLAPQMPPKPDPKEPQKQFVQESTHSVQVTKEELEAAERWRLLTAA